MYLVALGVYLASLALPKPIGAELPCGAELHNIEQWFYEWSRCPILYRATALDTFKLWLIYCMYEKG